jgi:hypothetical protein
MFKYTKCAAECPDYLLGAALIDGFTQFHPIEPQGKKVKKIIQNGEKLKNDTKMNQMNQREKRKNMKKWRNI